MEIYGECGVCGKWDDLIRWQGTRIIGKTPEGKPIQEKVTLVSACLDCYNKMDSHGGRGWTKEKIIEAVIKEIQNGKK